MSSSEPIYVVVPGDPRGQGRPRATVRNGHATVYKDAKTASYQNLVAMAANQAMKGHDIINGPVMLVLFVRFPIPKSTSAKKRAEMMAWPPRIKPTKKPDLSNILKAVEDGMNGIVFCDDSQIVTIHATKLYSETPGVEAWVSSIA